MSKKVKLILLASTLFFYVLSFRLYYDYVDCVCYIINIFSKSDLKLFGKLRFFFFGDPKFNYSFASIPLVLYLIATIRKTPQTLITTFIFFIVSFMIATLMLGKLETKILLSSDYLINDSLGKRINLGNINFGLLFIKTLIISYLTTIAINIGLDKLINRKMKFKKVFFIHLLLLVLVSPVISMGQPTPEKQEVYSNDFVRKTFYTWTTDKQINELRKNKTLLTKSKSETKGYSLFDKSIRDTSLKNNPIAHLLQEEQFSKKRFAWTNTWATVMGWKGESYGNHVIKIVLEDSSIIVKFDVSNEQLPLTFYDINGNWLTADYVLKNKSRIAAIYHINYMKETRQEWKKKRRGTFYANTDKMESRKSNIKFREFIVINEKMIKNWSYGTSEIKSEIESEIKQLKQYQKSDAANVKAYSKWDNGWYDLKESEAKEDYKNYQALTCFENDYYLFNVKRLQKIIDKLQTALELQSTAISK